MQPIVGPNIMSATAPKFSGFRDADAQEPGIPMRTADKKYQYVRDPQFEEIVEDARAKTFTIEGYYPAEDRMRWNWDSDIHANLRAQVDAMPQEEFLERAQFALPALTSLRENKTLNNDQVDVIKALEDGKFKPTRQNIETLKQALVRAQLRGLNSMANHALTAEEPSVAPLSFGIQKYSRRTDVRDAFHNFSGDEAKHTHILMRYVEKLQEDRQVSPRVEKMFGVFSTLAKVSPAAAIFLALNVEAQGGAYFQFMGENAPDPLYRGICKAIYELDEARHVKVMVELYNMLYRGASPF